MQQDESEKLKKHLSLLREEYVKLQDKYWKLEKKYNVMLATRGNNDDDSFVSNLLKTVAGLFEKELYSDLTVKLEQETFIKAHKFVLSARNGTWGDAALSETDSLDWRDMQKETAFSVLKWIYTDAIELGDKEDEFILDVMRCAKRFSLKSLQTKCEEALMSMVDVRNCVKFYQTADEIDAVNLRNHCSELISTHWNDFSGDDFVHMPASLMYNMCKAKTSHPLHTAIRLRREDVVFLYLIEYDAQLVSKVNEFDSEGDIPLDLALKTKQESVAKNLMAHKANVNVVDEFGKTLLHRALERKDKFSACFLIDNGAAVDIATSSDKESPLHLLCRNSNNQEMTEVAEKLVLQGADPNWQDVKGNSCLHQAIISRNVQIFKLLLGQSNIALALRNAEGMTPLALALQCLDTNETFAKLLVEKGASVDAKNPFTGDTLLHQAAKEENEVASIFLITNNAKVNSTNNQGETPLHIAASKGLVNLVEHLLKYGANCNAKTSPVSYSEALSSQAVNYAHNQTPLHFAVSFRQQAIIKKIFDFRKSNPEISIDLNVKNSKEETPLSLAIAMKDKLIADILIEEGADINIVDAENLTLLHRAIINNDTEGAIFLLRRGADIDTRTPTNLTPLQLAIENQLESVVQELCARGAEVNLCDEKGNNPLWSALEKGNEDIASILVQNGCDTNFWSDGPGGCWQTMLHRAIDENNEFVGCFLIRSGCDVNVTRRPSPDGKGEEEAYDGQTPLHMACQWGLENVVQTLLEHGADVNIADAEGKTPLHIAIINQHSPIISLLLSHPALNLNVRDKYGLSPFATAMNIKNNKAAQAILDRDPTAAEKFDGKGRNFLHIAIQKGDIESVLFLLSINVNIHSKVQDASQLSPLHLAVESGSDLIVRNLLLAGANINDLTVQKQSALHIAAEKDHHVICSILIENGIKYDAVDVNLNNALHIACQKGNLAACKVLLTESQIKAEALNLRGQNPLHLLAQFGKENAAAIYDLFISSMPEYPINKPDAEGNTPLLLAYKNGNSNLCKSLVRSGACLGTSNRNDINIFNCQVASKNLLYKILDFLPQESPWSEGDSCLECGLKFGITNRKHHCRHCGRLVCNKCSAKEIPILKFNQSKPVRVCEVCFDVLSRGFQF